VGTALGAALTGNNTNSSNDKSKSKEGQTTFALSLMGLLLLNIWFLLILLAYSNQITAAKILAPPKFKTTTSQASESDGLESH
jgi:hypothetical protein